MLNKTIAMLLVVLLFNFATMSAVFANETKTEKEVKFAQKVKTEITKLGVGIDSKVQVKLKDGTKLKGYISEVNDEGFVVTDKEGNATPVPYNKAKQVGGSNTKTGLIIAVGIVVFLVIIALAAARS